MYNIKTFKCFPTFKRNFLARLPKNYLDPKMQNKCWLWRGGRTNNNYGGIRYGDKNYYAHRISYFIFKGEIPYGKIIRHTCDNRKCVNPKHLILGSYYNNSLDMVKRGRQSRQKLNTEAVKVIKWMLKYKYEENLIKKLATLYKVSESCIYDIKSNRKWTWVEV